MPSISELKTSLSFWELFGYVATALVFLGVVGESITELTNLLKSAAVRKRIAKISALVLILGLALEILSGFKVSGLNEQITAVLNKEAGDARRTGENASERAAKLESGNITLRTDLENARTKFLSAQTRLEREQQKTAVAQKEAARAQLAMRSYVDLLAKNVNPRTVDGARFVKLLDGRPKARVAIWYEPDDFETEVFADQLHMWLGSAGAKWDVVEGQLPTKHGDKPAKQDLTVTEVVLQSPPIGLAISSKRLSDSDGNTSLNALVNALRLGVLGGEDASGLSMMFEDPTLPEDHIVLVIGHHLVTVPLVESAPKK